MFSHCAYGKTLESALYIKEIKPINPKGNQLWLFIGRSDAEAEALILWPLDAKIQLWKKALMLRKIEGRMRSGQQRVRWLDGIIDPMDMTLSKFQDIVKDREAWCAAVHEIAKNQTSLSDWIKITSYEIIRIFLWLYITNVMAIHWQILIWNHWRKRVIRNVPDMIVMSGLLLAQEGAGILNQTLYLLP